ncbi:MAG: hypothetical protein AAB692_04600 [Patescibacteria group bacterium]
MAKRFLIGGPSNSGKSTFVLSLAEHLQRDRGLSVEAFEFDVWSGSYPAFRGEVTFKDRPKKFGLNWDWQTPLRARINSFQISQADVVFGDLPGILDEAIDLMCREAKADAALVVSHSQAGLVEWQKFFEDRGVPVEWRILTYKDNPPLVVSGMNRQLVPGHDDIVQFAAKLVGKLGP